MYNHIALESLIQRCRSRLYNDLVSVYQKSFDALYDSPGASDDYVLDVLNNLDLETQLMNTINFHLGEMIFGIKIYKCKLPSIQMILKEFQTKSIKRATERMTAYGVSQSITKLYDDKSGTIKPSEDLGVSIKGGIVIPTSFWRYRNTDNSFYFTAEELAAFTMHEIGHIDYCLQSFGRANFRIQYASDIIDYIKTHPDNEIVLKTIDALRKTKDLHKDWLVVLNAAEKYFKNNKSTKLTEEYLEAVSVVALVVMSSVASKNRDFVENLLLNKTEGLATKILSADKERSSDEFSSRNGAYSALANGLFKLEKINTVDSHVMANIYGLSGLYTAVTFLDNFVDTFMINAEDISNGYDSIVRRMELLAQTAKHAFKDDTLPEDIRRDLHTQIKEIESYVAQYNKIPHRQIRATLFKWKNTVLSLGRLVLLPINTRTLSDYSKLQDSTRDLSRNPLYYLVNK